MRGTCWSDRRVSGTYPFNSLRALPSQSHNFLRNALARLRAHGDTRASIMCPLRVLPCVAERRDGVKFQTAKGVKALHPQLPPARKSTLENNRRRTMWTMRWKKALPANTGPVGRILHKLPVEKESVLIVAKIGQGRTSPVPFGPESQSPEGER